MLSTLQTPRFLLPSRFPPHLRHFHKTTTTTLSLSPSVTQISLTDQSPASMSPPSQILSIRHSLLTRQITAVQLAESYLTRLALTEPHLHSFLHVSQKVQFLAEELDRKIARGEELGLLDGVLVGVKDNIVTDDMPSTGGSRVLERYFSGYDATAVRKVRERGGILVGKTNLDEFGMGSSTEGSAYQVFV